MQTLMIKTIFLLKDIIISLFCLDQDYDYIFLFKKITFATVKKKRHCYKMMRCVSV